MLEPLGISEPAERVYRALLQHGTRGARDLAAALGWPEETVAAALAELDGRGLAARTGTEPGRWYAAAPDVAVESLVAREYQTLLARQRELERVQLEAVDLVRQGLAANRLSGPDSVVEVTTDAAATRQRCGNLQRRLTTEIQAFDKAPYGIAADAPYDPANEAGEFELLARGIQIRGIYEHGALQTPGRFEVIQQLVAAGEQARALPELPMKLVVYDRAHAVVQLDPGEGPSNSAVFVHRSGLLDAILQLFEVLWERAVPIPAPGERPAEREHPIDPKVLALLTAGYKDEAIARHLGVSKATVTRRISRLMELSGAATRFQLGLQAGRLGWV